MPIIEKPKDAENPNADLIYTAKQIYPRNFTIRPLNEAVVLYGRDRVRSLLDWTYINQNKFYVIPGGLRGWVEEFQNLEKFAYEIDLWGWEPKQIHPSCEECFVEINNTKEVPLRFVRHCWETYVDFLNFVKAQDFALWSILPGPYPFTVGWYLFLNQGHPRLTLNAKFSEWLRGVVSYSDYAKKATKLVQEYENANRARVSGEAQRTPLHHTPS